MSELPERIWAYAWTGKTNEGQWQTYKAVGSTEYVRADLAQAPAPVRVNGLEWVDFHDRGAKAQAWNEANYMIQKWSDGRWEISASYPGYSTFIYGTDRFYPTLEDAKAAAQADHSTRILAALEAPDAGVVAELVEALRDLLAAYSKPDERICCNGHECGCQGATAQMMAEHYAKEALAKLGGKANG